MRPAFVTDFAARGLAALGCAAFLCVAGPVCMAAPADAAGNPAAPPPASPSPASPAPASPPPVLDDQCPGATGFLTGDEKLTMLAGAIAAGQQPVDVLAVGSAATIGEENGAGGSFPYYMIGALHAALPKIDFRLTVQGARGLTAQEMLKLLDAQLAAHRYPLVLWQTGTVEAVRGLRPDALHTALAAGVQHVRARGGDTVLIDPPFSRALRANTEIEPYERVLHQVAALPGVLLFPRYDLTRHWVDKGYLDVERAPKADRAAAVDMLHDCVGRALAAFVLRNLALTPAASAR